MAQFRIILRENQEILSEIVSDVDRIILACRSRNVISDREYEDNLVRILFLI
jgi:hypothetical protein